ncbi:MAG: NAD-dependent epimerase/dehydratase family protein, partial [Candidatus Nitrosocosmicus sp.]
MAKKVLITGGAGFIGSNLALALLKRNYKVTVLDNLSKQIHGEAPYLSPLFCSIKDRVNFIEGDVCDHDILLKALQNQDILVHFAAETGTGQSMYAIEHYCKVNIGGTALILDFITNEKSVHIEKMLVASSRSIYGEGKYKNEEGVIVYPIARNDEDMAKGDFEAKCPYSGGNIMPVPTDEESKIHPSSIYGITKQNQEQMFLTVGNALGIGAVALRYQNVYGPGQSLSNPYTGILSIFSTLIKNNKGINVFEDGKESRDFVFIDDVVAATILAIETETANGNVYNVGSGVATDVLTVANTLITKYGSNVPITVTGNYRLGDIRHNYADLTKIKNDLHFTPTYDFETGIEMFVQWVNEQQVHEIKY